MGAGAGCGAIEGGGTGVFNFTGAGAGGGVGANAGAGAGVIALKNGLSDVTPLESNIFFIDRRLWNYLLDQELRS